MKFDDLVFPKLLPGHKWVVRQDLDCYASWDQLIIQIRKDRRWFSYMGYSTVIWLDRAERWWKDVDFDPGDVPEESELWRRYVLATAEGLHEKYVKAHQAPIRNKQVKELVDTWTEELNA
jgi:hypothetical protein